MIIFPFFYI